MGFKSLGACVDFLEKNGDLVRIKTPIDPNLEMAAVHNRVFAAGGPAILFEQVKGSKFSSVSNVFGTHERALSILAPDLERVTRLVGLKFNPLQGLLSPSSGIKALTALVHALPSKRKNGPVLENQCRLSDLPAIRCWPGDGGAFILLPQVFSMDPDIPGILHSNVGMYRIQMGGNDYVPDREVGLHYQIHRGIGNHHTRALKRGESLPVSIFVGGPPAHTLAAVMPLPEGLPEVAFAGALAGRRFRYGIKRDAVFSLDADFCITGRVTPGRTKKEGPFGDHLGYYSLAHDFPVLEVTGVFHRKRAIWPFTVVGRPPREDSIFGKIIHDITADAVPKTIQGVTAVHAVDAAGVHPLLLAKAMERYVPYEPRQPRELLTHAGAILGFGQLSLAKYLLICAHNDRPDLNISDTMGFFIHLLERIDLTRDVHFLTATTMDTLDYSSPELNRGSKVILAAAGEKKRDLLRYCPDELTLSPPFAGAELAGPGMLAVQAPAFKDYESARQHMDLLVRDLEYQRFFKLLPLVVVVDDVVGTANDFDTFLWVTFSRSNPSHDIYGGESFTTFKHWGCKGPLIIDARIKPFHAPVLEPDKDVEARVDALGRRGGPLHGII
ncbi:UbiD family decarboxylase [Desulfocicer niacini]